MSSRKMFSFRLPVDLVERVDAAAGPGGRTEFWIAAAETALGGEKISTGPVVGKSHNPGPDVGNPISKPMAGLKASTERTFKKPEVRPVKRRAASSGDHAAVLGVLAEFPSGRTERQLAQALGWFEGRVGKVVREMERVGLVQVSAGGSVEAV